MTALPSPAPLAGILEDFRRVWKMTAADAKPVIFDTALRAVRSHYRFAWSTHQLEQELLAMLFITGHVQASSYTVANEAGEAWEREARESFCRPRPPLGKRYRVHWFTTS